MSINRVQYVSNATTGSGGTSLATTIASATANNLLIAHVVTGSTASNGTCSTPSGWTKALGPITNTSGAVSNVNEYLFYKIAAGGETSLSVTDSVSSGITCQIWEFHSSNNWPTNPVDQSNSSANQAATTSPVTGTTPTTLALEELWIAGMSTNGGTAVTYSSILNSFNQETTAWAGASPFFSPNSFAAYKIVSSTGAASSGATSSASKQFAGLLIAFVDNQAPSLSDTGSGANSVSGVTASFTATDTGSGASALSLAPVAVSLSQSGSGSDALASLTASMTVTQAGAGVDSVSITASLSMSQTGAGADQLTLGAVAVGLADSGVGTSAALSLAPIAVALGDVGAGVSAALGLAPINLTITEAGRGAESIATLHVVALGDALTGADSLKVAGKPHFVPDGVSVTLGLVAGVPVAASVAVASAPLGAGVALGQS